MTNNALQAKPRLFTIGHSTRPLAELLVLLHGHHITLLADVRTIPRSRYTPQFNSDTMAIALAEVGIQYRHCKNLGGLRHAKKDSHNTAWRNKSFRGYADYMETEEFSFALEEIITLAATGERIALMCAEGAPFRCHRTLIADAVVARGIPISEIISSQHARPHKLTSFAAISHGRPVYL